MGGVWARLKEACSSLLSCFVVSGFVSVCFVSFSLGLWSLVSLVSPRLRSLGRLCWLYRSSFVLAVV